MSKHIIITGAASGIGEHMAFAMLNKGHRVTLCDINADRLQQLFAEHPRKELINLQTLNVTSVSNWQAMIASSLSAFGDLDYLFNIAGIITPGFIHKTSIDDLDRQMDINAKGMMYGAKLAAELMVEQGYGHIINVASLAGVVSASGIAGYNASKFAVRGFSLAIAADLEAHGVKVTVICPDLVSTPMMEQQLDYAEESALVFSGNKALTVEDTEQAFYMAMQKQPVEILLPFSRGLLAKIGSFFPVFTRYLAKYLQKKGKAAILSQAKHR